MSAHQLIERTKARLTKEIGTIYKSHADQLLFALAFPNTYHVGMSNLGFQIVYGLLNERSDVVCERVFLPDPSDLEDLPRLRTGLFTLESQTPVHDFEVLGFSLSYEMDYPNVLKVLVLSGIPELSSERAEGGYPLVIAGGPVATFNPETMAEFIDVFVIGDGEAVLPELCDRLVEYRDADRLDLLKALAQIEGIYVPRFYHPTYNSEGTIQRMEVFEGAPEPINRRWVKNLDEHASVSIVTTPETEFSNMVLAEIARGCGRQCRFCAAGYTYLPPRSRSLHAVLADLEKSEQLHGRHKVGLVSASVFDHPSSLLICQSLVEKDSLFSISSTRADTLTERVIQALRGGGHETLTIAPEAGTDRLRRVINKCISDQDILDAAKIAWEGGYRKLRLYFMVGLPTERDEDIDGVINLASEIGSIYPWQKLNVSVSCFVPKPWTPFQWFGMEEEKSLDAKVSRIRSAIKRLRHCDIAGESPREAVAQGVLARGDRRLSPALLLKSRGDSNWRTVFRESGIDPHFYAHRARGRNEVLPWDHLDLGVRKEYLWRQYEQGLSEAASQPCEAGACRRCGVCR